MGRRICITLCLLAACQTLASGDLRAQSRERGPVNLTAPSGQSLRGAPANAARPATVERSGVVEMGPVTAPGARTPSTRRSQDVDLGRTPWRGTEPLLARSLLDSLPIGAPSPTMGAMTRAILLARGPQASGRQQPWIPNFVGTAAPDTLSDTARAFLDQRLLHLHEAGHIEDAEALAAEIDASEGEDDIRVWIQAVAALLDHEDEDACALSEVMRTRSRDVFWVKLRIYCYVRNGLPRPARTTAEVLRYQSRDEPLFDALLNALLDKTPVPDEAWREPVSALPYAMAYFAGIALPPEALARAEPAVLRAVAIDIQPHDPREPAAPADRAATRQALAAAERSVLTGALEAGTLARAYLEIPFTEKALADPIAAAPTMPAEEANALFFQVVERETIAASRVELVHAALEFAWENGSGLPVCLVYGDMLAAIEPDPDLAWAGGQLGLAALVAGQPALAYRWRSVLDQSLRTGTNSAQAAKDLKTLDMALAIAAPRPEGPRASGLFGLTNGSEVLPGAWMNVTAWVREVEQGGSAEMAENLEATLSLMSVLGHPLTTEAWAWLAMRQGRAAVALPSPALVQRAKDAVDKDRVAEALSIALVLAGQDGPATRSLSPMVSALEIIAGLKLEDTARRLALETFLVRYQTSLTGRKPPEAAGQPVKDAPGLTAGLAAPGP